MRIHLVQYDIVWEDKGANRAKVEDLLGRAEIGRRDLVVLPEMFETGFSTRVDRNADDDRSAQGWLARMSRERHAAFIGGITVRGPDGRGRNRALVFDAGGALACEYDKAHPFMGGESRAFSGGGRVAVAEVALGGRRDLVRVAPLVCYDLRFPEVFRACRVLGAEVFAVIANWPEARAHHWSALLAARAIENQGIVVGVNRVGRDPMARYTGRSTVVAESGEVLLEAGESEGVFSVEVDVGAVRSWRERFPVMADARAELLPRVDAEGRFSAESGAARG